MSGRDPGRWDLAFALTLIVASALIVLACVYVMGRDAGTAAAIAYCLVGAGVLALGSMGARMSGFNIRERYGPHALASVIILWPIAALVLFVGKMLERGNN